MNRRKGLTHNESDKAPVTFQDVAACFSDEEWELLHKWQKELYKNVMTEIHQALISLGPVIATSVFSLTPSEKEDVFPVDDQNSDRRQSRNHSPVAPISSAHPVPSIDNSQKLDHLQHTDKEKRKHINSTEHEETTILTISASIKEEGDPCPMPYQSSKKTQRKNRSSPSGFSSHGSESDGRFIDHIDGKGREANTSTSSGFQPLNTDSYSMIEEEPTVILTDYSGSELDKGNAGLTSVSFMVKEEDDTYSRERHQSKTSCNIIRNACEPVINPVFSQSVQPKNVVDPEEEPLHQEIPTGYGSMNMEPDMRYSAVFAENTAEFKGLPEKAKAKRTHSRSQLWTESKPGPSGDKTDQCESVFRFPLHSNTLQCTPLDEASQNYTTCKSDLRDVIVIESQPNAQQHWQPHASYNAETAKDSLGHRYSHMAKKHHNSNECEKSFSWKASLIEHKTAYVGERLYQCTECEKSFKHKETLTEHQRTHTGQRPYHCIDCGKSFIRKRTLIAHQRIHTGEKPYQCTGCGKSFSLKHNLNTHRRTCRRYP